MDSIAAKYDKQGIVHALQTLPTKLDVSYEDTMRRISEQDEESARLAEQVLAWLTLAVRPLSVAELQHALAVRPLDPLLISPGPSMVSLDDDSLIDEDILVSVCAGLVTIEPGSRIIRLVHYTADEYLQRTIGHRIPRAEPFLGYCCLQYLLQKRFASGACDSDDEMENRLATSPLLNYAGRYWGHHIQKAGKGCNELGIQNRCL